MPVRKQSGTVVTLEDSLAVSYKTKHTLTMISNAHVPGYLLQGVENVYTKTCPQMFIATLFIIAKTQKRPRCPSVVDSSNQDNQTMEYYSSLKRNELLSHEKT